DRAVLLHVARALARAASVLDSSRGRATRWRASQKNSRRTVCYHFATQLGSTGCNSANQIWQLTRKNLNKTALCETARHRTNQRPQNVVFSRRAPGISALAARRIAAGTAVALIAGLAHRLSRPAEAALLIALAGGRRAAVGRRSILAVG